MPPFAMITQTYSKREFIERDGTYQCFLVPTFPSSITSNHIKAVMPQMVAR